jgi:ribonucleoside-diphosphate reductase alpha chain
MQKASLDIWDKKYRLKDSNGTPIDLSISDTLERVAKALSEVESTPELRRKYFIEFMDILELGALPAGRILSNAGSNTYKSYVSTINCVVSDTIEDSMDGIFTRLHEAALTLKAGCGIGYNFSTLRPKGSFISGVGAQTSGPLSFMDVFDKMCSTVSSAGGRRGAQMAVMRCDHPDIIDFIQAKRDNSRLRHFNCSVLITEDFINSVINEGIWNLKWNNKIVTTIQANELWDIIMKSNYQFAEPGFILIDEVNKKNNLWFAENIVATNP